MKDKLLPGFIPSISLTVAAVACTNFLQAEVLPLSDPDNSGGWVLNAEVSDEFNGSEIDRDKWFVQGDDNEYYMEKNTLLLPDIRPRSGPHCRAYK